MSAGLLRVLVVDDNRHLAENLAELLSDEGCSVRTAFSAEEALRAAADAHFDLVLTDIRMPGMNGVELVRLLAQREPTATYLLMTAYTSDQVLSAASHLGVVRAVLAKPLAVERLLELLPRRSGVLLVEDDRRLAGLLEESLRRGGYAVHVSDTCEGAEEALQRARPDIAVIDCTLPGGVGMAFARRLCAGVGAGAGDAARRGWIPLIVFSGRETEAELRSATPSAIQFVSAPVSAESLLSALAQIKPEGKP
ncbi:response regulator [Nannocystis sp.]|uniref:response regulator n=1 Tax=Nannocystis sp. TaxID=1962667 RepID=UPI002422EEE5|nr:response regulator [Nannocystis sp.]MBK7826356.1 response regulator [Nannocystis sp.]MBK9757873.1 response regulator [Nannocystis sp.]